MDNGDLYLNAKNVVFRRRPVYVSKWLRAFRKNGIKVCAINVVGTEY